MNRRTFLSTAMGLQTAAAWKASAQARRLPNFLVILADDIGAKELACYGNKKHRTPNLDKLAQSGVQFQTCYATPICHPTRVEILTGQYGHHNGVHNFASRRGGPAEDSPVEDIGKNHVTFAEMLKERGYATAIAGKWQLSGKQPDLIHDCGFDEYCMWAFENYLADKDRPKYRARERYWKPAVIRNGEFVETTANQYGPDIFSDYLTGFMKRKRDVPFLAYYPMVLTHGPHAPSPDTFKSEEDKFKTGKQNYQACVEYMDKIVGKLVRALEENGLRENTIILFTGDNGTAGEGKGDATELGARVPMIVNGPGIKQRGATDELTDLSDVLPTLAEFAGAKPPKGKTIDGRSLAGFLKGEGPAPREWAYSYIADRRILRTKRFLLEDNSPLHWGTLFDCGTSRDGTGYRDVTKSTDPEVIAAKEKFDRILSDMPVPFVPDEGHPAELKSDMAKRKKAQQKKV